MQSTRNTRQRKLIISILKEAHHPLSINEIYDRTTKELPRIAKSTIYRNIDQLLEQNLIDKYYFNDNEIFYRYKESHKDHTHYIICDECKKFHNLPTCPMVEVEEAIEAEGFIIKDHQIQIIGICKNCANK
ncbi:MAG: transcriptional repressor [Clostridiales bacterium]|jgi:Fe2+ or Zn2+ uptake regulation protein|nr:Fur family transcriptional regulator [Bacillota bacterium]NLK04600.1 transcriptional repressor [Clostridiales bacterium]